MTTSTPDATPDAPAFTLHSEVTPERFFLAPHQGQTVTLNVTDELIAMLEDSDGVERMSDFYLAKYNAGNFGNKFLLDALRTLRDNGVATVEGVITEPSDTMQRFTPTGETVTVISSTDEWAVVWRGSWEQRGLGTTLNPAYFVLTEVKVTDETVPDPVVPACLRAADAEAA